VEASALQAPASLAPTRAPLRTPLLRLRSDEQLVALFRAGHEEAFRVIHDRYRQRLFAYTRQMLPRRQDAEDALQDVFVRAYSGLRASDRDLALRAWLYRVAHNRCIDELRRPPGPPAEVLDLLGSPAEDPVAATVQREALTRLVEDVRRLPDHQRSALLMRELGGMSYADMADALGVTVPAVKSLLVRARIALTQALAARDTACSEIREELSLAHDRGARPGANARRHLRDCSGCREFRKDLRGVSRQLAALAPGVGPVGVLAKVLGVGGGASGGTAAAGTGGAVASAGALATGVGHVATLIAATVVTAGGAVEIQTTISAPVHHRHHAHVAKAPVRPAVAQVAQPVVAAAYAAAVAAQPVSAVAATVPHDATSSPPAPASPPAHAAKAKADTAGGNSGKTAASAPNGWGDAWGTTASEQPDPSSVDDAASTAAAPGTDSATTGTGASSPGTGTAGGTTDGTTGTSSTGTAGSTGTNAPGTPVIGSSGGVTGTGPTGTISSGGSATATR
jgi:RNA polymerase sigma factor (sigma-70 family)